MRSLAKRTRINEVCDEIGVKSIFELFSYAPQNSLCPPGYEEKEIPWFDPVEGIEWIDAIAPELRAHPEHLEHASKLLDDLQRFRATLAEAKEVGVRWHFEMDM